MGQTDKNGQIGYYSDSNMCTLCTLIFYMQGIYSNDIKSVSEKNQIVSLISQIKRMFKHHFHASDILCNFILSELDIRLQFLNSIVCVPCTAIQERKSYLSITN